MNLVRSVAVLGMIPIEWMSWLREVCNKVLRVYSLQAGPRKHISAASLSYKGMALGNFKETNLVSVDGGR